ncbi:Vms1/Ankzf1 family peptidyl-tRNA hydrolase [Natronoarchaeum rubrum]|uniref:Vms1/Ankzf1 family peptidyl-tRNA hydrolase n=1 Tax=Natronoarchaeum rubrum TaxID=755311 RepID=UPI00211262C0|nr:Vms1/Ankzf1 family peptidyl-tRNA hydrolase [Natronoarchaeum rubrum]
MLDRLLGRASLKERVSELEDERESLRAQLEAEQERRADAVSDRQDAQERVNRLEDKIEQLEDALDRRDDADDGIEFRGVEELRGPRVDAVLNRLESVETDPEGIMTAMVDGAPSEAVRDAFGERAPLVARAAPCLAVTDDAGVVSAALDVPVAPEPFAMWSDGVELDREWFRPTGRYAVALVRADLFALGEYDGRERRSVSGFRSGVKSDHSKGGFSQGRFERLRDEQIDEHLGKCRERIAEREADRLYLLGDAAAIDRLDVDAAATDAVGATGDPEDALADAVREFFSVRLYRL